MSIYHKGDNKFLFHKRYTRKDFPNSANPIFGLENDIIKNAPLFWPRYKNGDMIVSIVEPSLLNQDQLKGLNCKLDDNTILIIGTLK